MTPLKSRERKRLWAFMNPAKVRQANATWRDLNADKVRRQARERMKRYRKRLRVASGILKSGVVMTPASSQRNPEPAQAVSRVTALRDRGAFSS